LRCSKSSARAASCSSRTWSRPERSCCHPRTKSQSTRHNSPPTWRTNPCSWPRRAGSTSHKSPRCRNARGSNLRLAARRRQRVGAPAWAAVASAPASPRWGTSCRSNRGSSSRPGRTTPRRRQPRAGSKSRRSSCGPRRPDNRRNHLHPRLRRMMGAPGRRSKCAPPPTTARRAAPVPDTSGLSQRSNSCNCPQTMRTKSLEARWRFRYTSRKSPCGPEQRSSTATMVGEARPCPRAAAAGQPPAPGALPRRTMSRGKSSSRKESSSGRGRSSSRNRRMCRPHGSGLCS